MPARVGEIQKHGFLCPSTVSGVCLEDGLNNFVMSTLQLHMLAYYFLFNTPCYCSSHPKENLGYRV